MQIILDERSKSRIINKAVSVLEKGGLVVYPSDTVYGMAVDATNNLALERLEKLKKRRADQKTSFNFSDLAMIVSYANPSPEQMEIIKKYLPGQYTFIVRDELSVRIPKNSVIVEITKALGRPTTATSANLTGDPAATSIKNLEPKIYLAADLIIEDPEFMPSEPSTVVDLRKKPFSVKRAGAVSFP